MTRPNFTSILAACILFASAPIQSSGDYSWRATVTSERAKRIAGELFPDKCGTFGDNCYITYDDRRACPFEFVVLFLPEKRKNGETSGAFITLDKNGGVVDVSSTKRRGCRNEDG